MMHTYVATSTIAASGAPGTVLGAIINPANSGVDVIVRAALPVPIVGAGNPPAMCIERYSTIPSSSVVDAASIPVANALNASSPAAKALIYTTASHSFSQPEIGSRTFDAPLPALALLDDNAQVVIPPGSAGVLGAVEDGGGVGILFALEWEERPVVPSSHLPSSTLPAAGALTAIGSYPLGRIAIHDETDIAIWITYTRASATGYPRVRCIVGNGSIEQTLPILDATIDASIAPPHVRQSAGLWEICLPPPGAAGAFVYPPLSFKLPVGTKTVWFQAAETGDTANPGTMAITYTAGTR